MRLKLLSGLLLCVFACTKVNQWKQPTSLCFEVVLEAEQALDQRVHYKGGTLFLDELVISGQRSEGGDVYFPITYDPAERVVMGRGRSEALTFDVPQGEYSTLSLEWKSAQAPEPDLTVEGTYQNKAGKVVPFVLELPLWTPLRIDYAGHGARASVALLVDKTNGEIVIDNSQWLTDAEAELLEAGTLVDREGIPVLLVNAEHNVDLYQAIARTISNNHQYRWEVTQ